MPMTERRLECVEDGGVRNAAPQAAAGTGSTALGRQARLWGIIGFSALLGCAILRLAVLARASLAEPWHAGHVVALFVSVAAMAYFEGYRAFQQSYAPRFAARAAALRTQATLIRTLLAPLYCMSLYDAPRRQLTAAWMVTAGIVVLVLCVRLLPQPWRGILDAGVVVGLSWGLCATLLACLRAR